MKCLDHTDFTPEENLACDEALLEHCEAGRCEGVLRFWEPAGHFVVVGYGNSVRSEVRAEVCGALGIPILRRCTGGGAVVQGPGCLSYALALPYSAHGPMATVTQTNGYIMNRQREAVQRALAELN